MNYGFCTISTKSHLSQSFALADSLAHWRGRLHILLVDENEVELSLPDNVQVHFLSKLNPKLTKRVIEKYGKNADKLRWCLKSVFLLHLLQDNDKMIYVDNDILFFNDFQFLFEKLETKNILLTPHNYKRNPNKEQNWFEANFRVGLFNAGFLAVNKNAANTLEWWMEACLYRCEKNYFRGMFDDQKYLDLFPVIEPKTEILIHKGCNVAEWNNEICIRTFENGQHLINGKYPVIFYHFNNYSLRELDEGDPIFKAYIEALSKYKIDLSIFYLNKGLTISEKMKLSIWKLLNVFNNLG